MEIEEGHRLSVMSLHVCVCDFCAILIPVNPLFWHLCDFVLLVYHISQNIQTTKKPLILLIYFGGQRWNRTTDTRIFSPLLYRLSYLAGGMRRDKIIKNRYF